MNREPTKGGAQAVRSYRPDIDGLRAIAVIGVIASHLGLMPNGFLGVDVFFVISGFLITEIIYRESKEGRFSIASFFERRVRRILPLALVVGAISLAFGAIVMLPDDLENLAQSVVATNLFANNVLQAITTQNYWDVVNDYKPLMHTWSLGVEEQFYLIWPLIFLVFHRATRKSLMVVLGLLIIGSLALNAGPFPQHYKFYFLPFRSFELAAGGLVALASFGRNVKVPGASYAVFPLLGLLVIDHGIPPAVTVVFVVLFSCGVMASPRPAGWLHKALLENRVAIYLGTISFSVYMWHQVVFAFARYAYFEKVGALTAGVLVLLVLGLSALSYKFVEQPFRDRHTLPLKTVLAFVVAFFCVTSFAALWLHFHGGVVRSVPELGIVQGEAGSSGMHSQYNGRVWDLNREFTSDRIRVLVIGNSFARDWANILLESKWSDQIEISYIYNTEEMFNLRSKAGTSDVVFWSEASPGDVESLGNLSQKVFVVGTKNFGKSAGIFYNYRGDDYFSQRVVPEAVFTESNNAARWALGAHYIDLMTPIMSRSGSVPVFTSEGKLISQDCRHLTRAGAEFYSEVLNSRLDKIFKSILVK